MTTVKAQEILHAPVELIPLCDVHAGKGQI